MLLSHLLGDWPLLRFPAELLTALAGGCAVLAGMYVWLIVRRLLAARQHEIRQAAALFAVREIAACVQGDDPVDTDHLRTALRNAPLAAVLQFLRLHRGDHLALVIEQAELAGVFDPAVYHLGRGVLSREIAALKQLQFARAPRFRNAVLKQVTRGAVPLVRCEALYTFVAMGSAPSAVALAIWIDGTGPACTPRHQALFQLIAERLPGDLPQLADSVTNPQFRGALAALVAAHPPPPVLPDAAHAGPPGLAAGSVPAPDHAAAAAAPDSGVRRKAASGTRRAAR